MGLVKPEFGLIFWMFVSFMIIFLLLRKFAWRPILTMIKEREVSIQDALDAAQKAQAEMKTMQANNQKLLKDAQAERDNLIREARETKELILNEAKAKATKEGERIIASARETIQNEKLAAITELKNQVATLSVQIAEKILKEELSSPEKQKTLVKALLEEVNLN